MLKPMCFIIKLSISSMNIYW